MYEALRTEGEVHTRTRWCEAAADKILCKIKPIVDAFLVPVSSNIKAQLNFQVSRLLITMLHTKFPARRMPGVQSRSSKFHMGNG